MSYRSKKEQRARYKKWKESDPEKVQRSIRRAVLRRLGWTLDAYEEAREQQENKCAICGNLVEGRNMDADHIHVYPPVPRGLLCNVCNQMLGLAKDNIGTLLSAVEYIKKYEGKTAEVIPLMKRISHQKGKPLPEETKRKISATKLSNPFRFIISEATREKLSKAALGRKASEETRIKLSLAKTGTKHSPESKEKMRAAKKGKSWSAARRAAYERKGHHG